MESSNIANTSFGATAAVGHVDKHVSSFVREEKEKKEEGEGKRSFTVAGSTGCPICREPRPRNPTKPFRRLWRPSAPAAEP